MDHRFQLHTSPYTNETSTIRHRRISQDGDVVGPNLKNPKLSLHTDSAFPMDSVVPEMLSSPEAMTPKGHRHHYHHRPRKASVTFDFNISTPSRDPPTSTPPSSPDTRTDSDSSPLSDTDDLVPLSPPAVSLPTPIPINGQIVPAAILVALLERDREMRELVRRNDQFFAVLKHHIADREGGAEDWARFKNLLFAPRESLPDRDWIEALGEHLSTTPAYWCKFKELVGYDEAEVEAEQQSSFRDPFFCGGRVGDVYVFGSEDVVLEEDEEEDADDEAEIELTRIRDVPDRLARLEDAYPRFFESTKRALENGSRRGSVVTAMMVNEARTEEEADELMDEMRARQEERSEQDCEGRGGSRLYREFAATLLASRRDLDDEEWEAALLDCLEGWPNLVVQLKEIVAVEIGQD